MWTCVKRKVDIFEGAVWRLIVEQHYYPGGAARVCADNGVIRMIIHHRGDTHGIIAHYANERWREGAYVPAAQLPDLLRQIASDVLGHVIQRDPRSQPMEGDVAETSAGVPVEVARVCVTRTALGERQVGSVVIRFPSTHLRKLRLEEWEALKSHKRGDRYNQR